MAECSDELRRNGKPSPRTCAHCGLGPCPFREPKDSAMSSTEDAFSAPPLPDAGETLPTSLPASVAIPGHTAPAPASPSHARADRLDAAIEAFTAECRAIGGRDAQIAITNAEQAMLWARRALKVA